jgi:hypothetical protein
MSGDGHRRYSEAFLDFLRSCQAIASACQADVHQHEAWVFAIRQTDQLLAGSCSTQDRMAQSGEFASERLG